MLHNLKEYHRPTDIGEAYKLLQRTEIRTIVLASGINIVGRGMSDVEAVVDLSDAGLDFVKREGEMLHLGAMVRLQTMVEELVDVADGLLSQTAKRMAGRHIRNMAALGSTLATGDIHTPLSVALAALDAQVRLYMQAGELPTWAELASKARISGLHGQLITTISLKLRAGTGAAYEQVGRTPADRPIVCAAAVAHPVEGGFETALAVGGLLKDLTVIDHALVEGGTRGKVVEEMAGRVIDKKKLEAAYLDDYLGSAEYRKGVAPALARRALEGALKRAGAG